MSEPNYSLPLSKENRDMRQRIDILERENENSEEWSVRIVADMAELQEDRNKWRKKAKKWKRRCNQTALEADLAEAKLVAVTHVAPCDTCGKLSTGRSEPKN